MSVSPVSGALRDRYESGIQAARTRFARDSAIPTILAPDLDPVVLELFLIYFSALGVSMTEPVEGWIRRAGERCEQIGLTELGRSLRPHAKHEAGHHLMLIEDTRRLVARWNARRAPPLDADQLLAQPVTDGVRMYRKLHEEVIASDAPFGQLAIEYEIEGLSVRYGPQLIDQCVRLLGSEVMAGLSFLEEHVSLDVGHTRFNEQQLDRLLDHHPGYVGPLVSAGARALDAYGAFLNDCVRLARAQARSIMSNAPPLPLRWEFHPPPGGVTDARLSLSEYAWLAELTEMRGRVLYDGGCRPAFRLADGSFADRDPLDAYAYHVLVRSSACLIGCCRVVPLVGAPPCGTESLLGRERFNRLLLELGTTHARCGEASRWIAVHEHRSLRVGLRLVAGVWNIFRWLGLQTVIAMVGTHDGQDRVLLRIGGRPVLGLAPLQSQKFDDEIRVFSFDVSHPAKSFEALIDEMAAPLGLEPSISNVNL